MKTTCFRAVQVLAIVWLGGCSGSDESQVSELPMADTRAVASLTPTTAAAAGSAAAITSSATSIASDKVEGFRNPFAPPKDPPPPPVVKEPDPIPKPVEQGPAPEIRQPGTPPKIRLLGFMNVGEPKVLVSYRNELESLSIGDTLEDMQVVKIESPELTMVFDEREIKLSLFDQEWRHEGGSASGGNGSRVPARPRAPRSSVSAGLKSGGPTREPGGIPGFAPNAGKPPGFQPPASSGTVSTPAAPIGSPPPSLPGLSGEPARGAGISDGAAPGIPGLDVDADGKPESVNWPALPGAL